MKKALSFAVALGLVAGFAATASAATMDWSGDARWRGLYSTNTMDSNDNGADKIQAMDQRYRFYGDLEINEDVKVAARIVLADQLFGNNQPGAMTLTTSDGATVDVPTDSHQIDRFHMTIKAFGGSWLVGRQNASWGNKFLGWGSQVDRIKAVYKSGDLTYGGYLQKTAEGNDNFGDGDKDTYAGFIVGQSGNVKWGVLANYLYDDTKTSATSNGESEDGYLIDPFITVKAGNATILGELVLSGGDAGDNPAGDDYYGGFVGGAVGMDALTVKGLIAFYDGNMGGTGGRDCDNDFAPSVLIGTCQETAVIDFGETTGTTDDSTYLVGAGVDFKVNDKLTLGALVGYLLASEEGGPAGDEDATLVEYDLTAQYQLAQNATYHLSFAYADVDKFSATDDGWIVIGNGIEVKW